MKQITHAREALKKEFETLSDKKLILKSVHLRALFDGITEISPDQRASYGKAVNELKQEVQAWLDDLGQDSAVEESVDVTAPWDVNVEMHKRPQLLSVEKGSIHPLRQEIDRICSIYQRMGFAVEESRELDDDYHMFGSLNFPEGHPARDDYDTFMTDEGFVAPAHTSTMQNRVLKKYAHLLNRGEPIAVVVPDRVFRNEDIDATHEHTFYQIEGVYVGRQITVGNLIATLSAFMNEYFGQELKTKLQPFYFPFTEPSFEFAIERPEVLKKNDSEEQKWLELLGCGMIHPNVLEAAGIDSKTYSGFAWGNGIERMVMLRNQIEDIRHFESGKLTFLRQF
ncbi:MAG TPA: phenylalanine--tRNA ligase subunit alpha [Candidatus Saccharibacteria bacterium]|jgi:phenylalanyl-tRNA synthetase alpha chain|nr:phenylalanine--tRNA ligase subunit alpha [Candidatus Saccharibacteria bacterium]HMT55910.1 phenylalanine--tRNA ligase subunit alpha [Candidatus Saccharibacteria bacterium]